MDEFIDIVDENDNIIGQERKSKCHAQKILHRGSTALCFKDNSHQELLLNKRSLKKRSSPGKICFPGGHLEQGESYIDGVMREFCEEMCSTKYSEDIKFKKLFKRKKFTDNDYEYITVFTTTFDGPFNIDTQEVESYYFEKVDILLKDIKTHPEKYTGTTRLIMEEYEKRFIDKG